MKKIVFIIMIAFSGAAAAQGKLASKRNITVPSVVKAAFKKEFETNKASWEYENKDYEAEFTLNESAASALYDKNGHRKELEISIKTYDLPQTSLDYLKKKHPSDKLSAASRITDNKNKVTYEAEIQRNGKAYDILFDYIGNFVSIQKSN